MDEDAQQLHTTAFLALRGCFPRAEGEKAIADLLRSSVPIDPLLRDELAQALHPVGKRLTSVRLKLADTAEGKFVQQIRTRRRLLKRGRVAIAKLDQGASWRDAVEEAAEQCRCGPERVEDGIAYARRFDEWSASFEGEQSQRNASYLAWLAMFHVADVLGISPAEHAARVAAQLKEAEDEWRAQRAP